MTSSTHSTPGASRRPDDTSRRRSRLGRAVPALIVVVGLLELLRAGKLHQRRNL